MLSKRTITIIKRELKMKLFSKSFILMTFLVPLFMIMIFSIQFLIHSLSDEQRADIIFVSDSDEILNKIQGEIYLSGSFKSGDITARFEKTDFNGFSKKLTEIKEDIIAQRITGVVFIPTTSLQSKGVEYYSSNPNNSSLFYKIKPSINKALVEIYFSGKQLTQDEITFARKDVEINGFKTSIVKVIPLGDQGEVILSTYWIDQKMQIIRKVESTTKTNGTFTIDFTYDDKIKYPLPAKIVFAFNMDKMNIPATISGETNNEKPDKKNKNSETRTKGKVIVNYSNYVVNKGVPDSVFEEENKKSK